MKYKITNITKQARWCHDKLVAAGEYIEVGDGVYYSYAKNSQFVFDVVEIKIIPEKVDKIIENKPKRGRRKSR